MSGICELLAQVTRISDLPKMNNLGKSHDRLITWGAPFPLFKICKFTQGPALLPTHFENTSEVYPVHRAASKHIMYHKVMRQTERK